MKFKPLILALLIIMAGCSTAKNTKQYLIDNQPLDPIEEKEGTFPSTYVIETLKLKEKLGDNYYGFIVDLLESSKSTSTTEPSRLGFYVVDSIKTNNSNTVAMARRLDFGHSNLPHKIAQDNKTVIFEFENQKQFFDFSYFTRNQIEPLLLSAQILVYGTMIDFGDRKQTSIKGKHFTFGLEAVTYSFISIPIITPKYINLPKFQIGIPCPPDWPEDSNNSPNTEYKDLKDLIKKTKNNATLGIKPSGEQQTKG